MSESLHDLRLGPAPVSDAEQASRRLRFAERLAEAERAWQAPKTAADAYRNIANDWQTAYEQQAADLADCRALLAALVEASHRFAEQPCIPSRAGLDARMDMADDWLAEHPAPQPEGGQANG